MEAVADEEPELDVTLDNLRFNLFVEVYDEAALAQDRR